MPQTETINTLYTQRLQFLGGGGLKKTTVAFQETSFTVDVLVLKINFTFFIAEERGGGGVF